MDKITNSADQSYSPSPNAMQRGVESAEAAFHEGIDKLANPARGAVDSLSATAHESVDAVANKAGQMADRFADETRKMTEAPRRAMKYSRSCIQGSPLEAVGIALALGFVFGRLTAR